MMGQEDLQRTPPKFFPRSKRGSFGRGPTFQLAALALVVLSGSAMGFLMLRLLQTPPAAGGSGDGNPVQAKPSQRLFRLWPKNQQPDLVLVLSGETYSYLQPCGCSSPQYGGLARRYNFVQGLIKERHWPVAALDLGDVAQPSGPQALLKYTVMMKALHKMDYTAVGIGRNETMLPLIDALSDYALNNPFPRVLAANLLKKEENFPTMVKSWEVAAKPGAPRVGVAAAVDGQVAGQITDQTVKFADIEKVLPDTLKEMAAQKPDILVLLLQGTLAEAKKCAAKFPQFHVILCLSNESDPPEVADRVGKTLIVTVGHKGRYVGTVGVFRTGKAEAPFDLHYQLVLLAPEYETPAGQEANNPMHALIEEYAREVKAANYLSQYPRSQHPLQAVFKGAAYVGSEACKKCHQREYDIWKASPHARAYETLVKARRPALRQYDGECVKCHVTGFEYTGGFTDETATPLLKNNGCENCHGPGSLHVKGNKSPNLLALMNPYKTKPGETEAEKTGRVNRLDMSCQKCHDIDNDVHWNIKKWVEGKIAH